MLFKNQYHNFVAGLPDFTFESSKLPFTSEQFYTTLKTVLKPRDFKLLSKIYLSFDNDNLFNLLCNADYELSSVGNFSKEELLKAIEQVKQNKKVDRKMPKYFAEPIEMWVSEEEKSLEMRRNLEDQIASLYMDWGMEIRNSLIAKWFEMNLNIGNIISALTARQFNIDVESAIVGTNKVANIMRQNIKAHDFGLSDHLSYYAEVQRIFEEKDIYARERKIDKFRWDWLETNTIFDYFNVEYIFAYLSKLMILERWVELNSEEGEQIFRELIERIKNEIDKPEGL